MSNILLVTSSPRGDASHSTTVGRTLALKLAGQAADSAVTIRDVAAEPLPHLDGALLGAIGAPDRAALPAAQREAAERADALIDEVFAADALVIASPMVNFGPTSTLKAWFDHILRAGKTFRYTEAGPEGLVKDKKAYIVIARGGVYSDGPMQAMDFQVPYLKTLLGFIGITDVETIAVEGVAFGPDHAEKAVTGALAQVDALPAPIALAA